MPEKKTILIIDDSALILSTLQDALAAGGYEVMTAANGKEGLSRIQERTPDVILMDVVMPIMDGWETCRRVRMAASLQSVPIIIMTQKNTPQDLLRAFEVGADEFLEKPIDRERLFQTMDLLMKRRLEGSVGAR